MPPGQAQGVHVSSAGKLRPRLVRGHTAGSSAQPGWRQGPWGRATGHLPGTKGQQAQPCPSARPSTRGPGCGARHVELYSHHPGDPQGLHCPPHSSGQGVAHVATSRAALYQRLSKRPAESQPPTACSARARGGFRGQQRPRPGRDTCPLGGSSRGTKRSTAEAGLRDLGSDPRDKPHR